MNTAQTIKTGTRIEVFNAPSVGPELATIGRWTKANGSIKNHVSPTNGGWHVIRFDDGGKLLMHESGFRIISNRAKG